MARRFEGENHPLRAALFRRGAALAAVVSACGGGAHIEPTSPTPAPAPCATAEGPAVGSPLPGKAPSPAPTTPPLAQPPKPGACPLGSSALSDLCCGLASALGIRAAGAVVVVRPVASQTAVPRADDLSTHVAECVARAVGGGASALRGAVSLEQARAAAGAARSLVYVTPELSGGRLHVKAAAYALAASGPRAEIPPPLASAEATCALDGELGAYLPRIAVSARHVERVAASADVVALSCGEIAPQTGVEIVAVGRHKVQVGRAGDGRFSIRAETSWASLSPIAPSPLREPIGGAAIERGAGVLVGISDRAEGFLLSPTLSKLRALGAPVPLDDEWGCFGRAGVALGAPRACEPHGKHVDEGSPADAFAAGRVVDAEGRSVPVMASRDAATHRVTLRRDGAITTVAVAGSALALGDLDLDGEPELLASVDTDDPAEDAVVVSSWGRDGTVTERLRIPMKDGVRALAVCPVVDVRMAPIVVATTGGLWIVE